MSFTLYQLPSLIIKVGATAQKTLLDQQKLAPAHVHRVVGGAGGPKGLILNELDRHLFSEWFQDTRPLELIGASIGAWRMAAACCNDPGIAFRDLLEAYCNQHYTPRPTESKIGPDRISEIFRSDLSKFFEIHPWRDILSHRSYNLNFVVSQGRSWLDSDFRWIQNLGFLRLIYSNSISRSHLEKWMKRLVFYSHTAADVPLIDFKTEYHRLTTKNSLDALLASCSIPLVLDPVKNIGNDSIGKFWDGGITDYHLHWDYRNSKNQITLYPHFQEEVIPGWFDKKFKKRHRWTSHFDNVVLIYPNPEFVSALPRKKIPDRGDFKLYGEDWKKRKSVWLGEVSECKRFVEDFQSFCNNPTRFVASDR